MADLKKESESPLSENGHESQSDGAFETSGDSGVPGFHKRLVNLAKNMPQEDRDKFPSDYSENLDHYLYGMPKKSP